MGAALCSLLRLCFPINMLTGDLKYKFCLSVGLLFFCGLFVATIIYALGGDAGGVRGKRLTLS